MKEESTFGIEPRRLRRLFNIGRDTKVSSEAADNSREKAEILRRSLSQALPLDQSQIDMLPSALGQLYHSIGLLAGETIGDLLNNPSTDLSLIRKLKRHSKDLSSQAKSAAENDVATTIYYAAIAHALVFHNKRITRFPYEKLKTSFSRLVRQKWISKDLSLLLRIACKHCTERK